MDETIVTADENTSENEDGNERIYIESSELE